MTTYYIHYTDGTTEPRHWCDECDEREAIFHREHQSTTARAFWDGTKHDQVCRDCFYELGQENEIPCADCGTICDATDAVADDSGLAWCGSLYGNGCADKH